MPSAHARWTIRPARAADADAIAAVHVAGWNAANAGDADVPRHRNTMERRSAQWVGYAADPSRIVFVADADDRVVGCICGGAMPSAIRGRAPIPGYDAYVDALYVDPAFHRSGIGRSLLATLAHVLRERGFATLALHVATNNPAVRFYVHLGARLVAEQPPGEGDVERPRFAYGWASLAQLERGDSEA